MENKHDKARKRPGGIVMGLLAHNFVFLGAWGFLVALATSGQPPATRIPIVTTGIAAFILGATFTGWRGWKSRLSDWRHYRRVARLRRRGFIVCSDCAEPLCEVCSAHRNEPHTDACPLSSQHRSRIPTPREIPVKG